MISYEIKNKLIYLCKISFSKDVSNYSLILVSFFVEKKRIKVKNFQPKKKDKKIRRKGPDRLSEKIFFEQLSLNLSP